MESSVVKPSCGPSVPAVIAGMRTLLFRLTIGALILIGCNGDGPTAVNVDVSAGTEFALREGQVAAIGGRDVSVQVTNIVDHRCPPDLSLSCQGISYSDLY